MAHRCDGEPVGDFDSAVAKMRQLCEEGGRCAVAAVVTKASETLLVTCTRDVDLDVGGVDRICLSNQYIELRQQFKERAATAAQRSQEEQARKQEDMLAQARALQARREAPPKHHRSTNEAPT